MSLPKFIDIILPSMVAPVYSQPVEVHSGWEVIPSCTCPFCQRDAARVERQKGKPIPGELAVSSGTFPDLPFRAMLDDTSSTVKAAIQIFRVEDPSSLGHVMTSVPVAPSDSLGERVRTVLSILLIHELDEGLRLDGRMVRDPHGAHAAQTSNMTFDAAAKKEWP